MTGSGAPFDIAVVGGGLVGSALAWGLARKGAKVVVLDEGDDAFRASRGNFGLVWVQSKGDGMAEYAAWTRRSAEIWPDLANTLSEDEGVDVGLRQPGGLHAYLDQADYDAAELSIRRMHNQGLPGRPGDGANDSRMLTGDEARDVEPALGPEVIGASFNPHDGHVNPLFLLRGLHKGFQRFGVDYRSDSAVGRVSRDGDGYRLRRPSGRSRPVRSRWQPVWGTFRSRICSA